MAIRAPVKPTTGAQKVAAAIAHLGALTSVILVSRWAKGVGDGYLGGLDWQDDNLMFNYHPVLMVRASTVGWYGIAQLSNAQSSNRLADIFTKPKQVAGMVFCFTEALLAYRTFPLPKKQVGPVGIDQWLIACLLDLVRAPFFPTPDRSEPPKCTCRPLQPTHRPRPSTSPSRAWASSCSGASIARVLMTVVPSQYV